VKRTGEPVRLFHISGFDPRLADAISTYQNIELRNRGISSSELASLSREYSGVFIKTKRELGSLARYMFSRDFTGRSLSKRLQQSGIGR